MPDQPRPPGPCGSDTEGDADCPHREWGAPNTPWSVPQDAGSTGGLPHTPSPIPLNERDGSSPQEAESLRTALAQPPDSPPPRRRLLGILTGAVLLVVVALLSVAASHHFWWSQAVTTAQLGGRSSVAARVDPALVDINLTLGDQSAEAAATGIVLTPSGLVLTNNHVVNGATTIKATDLGNGRIYSATVLGYDLSKDVALIQLHGASGLRTAQLGDSSAIAVGQAVVAIGNAGGVGGAPSVAGGPVVALNQSITASDDLDGTSEQLAGLVQTDADIQPSDSGGPLVNTSGQVVAMDTAASNGVAFNSPSGQHVEGFAIPIDTASAIVSQIQSNDASASVQSGFESGFGSASSGATIAGAVPDTPAAQARLAAGDTIVSVDGQSVSSPTALTTLLGRYSPGDKVTIGWTDTSGEQHSSAVTLASGPAH